MIKKKRGRQGILFRVRLGRRTLSLWFLGLIPLGVIRLNQVCAISQTCRRDFWRWSWRRLLMPWRFWFWPCVRCVQHPRPALFLVETESGASVWMYLRAGLHYQLREAVHRNRMPEEKEPEMALGENFSGMAG